MDTILIIILSALVIGISAYLISIGKKGGCASCQYNDSCASREKCRSEQFRR